MRFFQGKPRLLYLSLSALSMFCGVLLYYFFRSSNILIYSWLDFLPKNSSTVAFSSPSFLTYFFRYNLPDGLWLLSGLLFFRAIWEDEPKTCFIYKTGLLAMALSFEVMQAFNIIPGTFDILDLFTMGSIALLEGIAHKTKLRRSLA